MCFVRFCLGDRVSCKLRLDSNSWPSSPTLTSAKVINAPPHSVLGNFVRKKELVPVLFFE